MMRLWRTRLLILFGVISLAVAGFGAGVLGTHFNMIPTRNIDRVSAKLQELRGDVEEKNVASIFLRMSLSGDYVPVARSGTGGGMSRLGDSVLLMAHDGALFHATGPGDVMPLDIAAPDQGYDALAAHFAANADKYRGANRSLAWFRVNDIHAIERDGAVTLLASFSKFFEEDACYSTVVARLDVPVAPDAIRTASIGQSEWQDIFRTEPCLPLKKVWRPIEGHMAGGRITHDGGSKIYLASGDYHWDGIYAPKAVAQLDDYDYGKVIEIDIDTGASRSISKGNRNMQGIAFDSNRDLFAIEHGIRGGDELNLILEGRDYGFPQETLGTLYSALPVPGTISYGRHEVFEAPRFAWLPSVALSSLNRIDRFHPAWDGDLLAGTLKDQSLYRIRLRDRRVLFAERIPVGERIRYVLPVDNAIVLWTDSKQLLWMTQSGESFSTGFMATYFEKLNVDIGLKTEIQTALLACRECHSLDPGEVEGAPTLAGIFRSNIGSGNYQDYSAALKNLGGTWTRENLASMIRDSQSFVPGTTMPSSYITDENVIEGLVDFFEAIDRKVE